MPEPFACLFPGQGAQFVGMGREVYEHYPRVREVFAAAEEVLGRPLAQLCLEGPEETLTATRNAQLAIFTLSVAIWELLKDRAIRPAAAAGHSVGEYAALVCAGAIGFEEGLRLVSLRGELMEDACRLRAGTMAAILGLHDERVGEICRHGGVTAANYNCPGQVVISGPTEAVAQASQAARRRGGKVIRLAVSGAFHSPLMETAQAGLTEAPSRATICDAAFPVYCNVDASAHVAGEDFRAALARQVTNSVLWKQSLMNMNREDGINAFVEVGSEKVLSGMTRRTIRGAEMLSAWDVASLQKTIACLGEE